mgnify:CR=1 FL=1
MVAITCTLIICATVILCVFKLSADYKSQFIPEIRAQQPITQEDLEKAYQEAEKDKIPDFQEVINYINKEFTGVEGDDEE